jgi:hypothetical protein
MHSDNTLRRFRFVEALDAMELTRKRGRGPWKLVSGWLEAAEAMSPRTPKALLEGDFVVGLSDGSVFKEISYKAECSSIESTLDSWARASGRRWARFDGEFFRVSDGITLSLSDLSVERSP